MQGQTVKILLVEDNEGDYHLLKRMLFKSDSSNSYALDWCPDFKTGLESVLKKEHDIYFIDYMLDNSSGLDLVAEAYGRGNEGPYIFLTGYDNPELYRRSVEIGGYDYILKNELSASLMDRTISYALQRKQVETALRQEKELTSFIVSEMPYLVISVSRDGKILTVNPTVTQVTGYQPQELINKHWKTLILEDDGSHMFRISDNNDIGFEAPLLTKDGQERTIQWNVLNRKIHRSGDENVGFILSGKDMTAQKEAAAQERQKEKMEALGHLAGGVAHEINNLLQPIFLAAEIVKAKTGHDDALTRNVEKILRNADAASKIVDDILAFSRIESKTDSVLPFFETFTRALDIVRDMLPKEIVLDLDYQSNLGSRAGARIKETDLIRVLSNLLINASHAMSGKGCIKIIKSRKIFTQRSEKLGLERGDYIQVEIRDSGTGIEKKNLEKIFNPFFTTKEIGKGTGLGLPIVYNVLRSWGGAVDVDSVLQEGTTFTLYIPLVHMADDAATADDAFQTVAAKSTSIH